MIPNTHKEIMRLPLLKYNIPGGERPTTKEIKDCKVAHAKRELKE